MPVTLPLAIDRIHMTVGVPSHVHFSFLISQLYGLLDIQGDLLPEGKLTIRKEKYLTQLNFWPSKGRKVAEIIGGCTKSKYRYFKLVLYPAKFREEDFARIKNCIEVLLSEWPYKDLFFSANVSYVEIARDFVNKDCSEYFPYQQAARKSKVFAEKNGALGSICIGSTSSNKRYCVYDKAKQLIKKVGTSNFKKLMRVEVRLRKTGLKPYELLESLKNPFHSLEILSIQKLLCISNEEAWLAFIEQCRCVGTAQALGDCDKKIRKIYKARLVDAKVEWWDSTKTWRGWPKAFAAIVP